VENVYISLKQIYLGNGVPNFIRIAGVLYETLQKKHSDLFFLDTVYNIFRRFLKTSLFILLCEI